MAFDRWHTAFYANSFTLASLYVCVWEDVWKNGDFFDILNYGWSSSILRVVLAEDFDFSSQHHMKCPALLQVLLAILLFIFSDFPASPCVPWVAGWGESSTLQLPLVGYGGAMWDPQRMFFIFCPFLFYLNPRTSGSHHVFRTGLEGHEQAALCSPFPCSKLLLSFVWTGPVSTFPFSFQWDMESLTSPQQGKDSSHLCWSSHFPFPSSIHIILKQILRCNAESAKASVSSWELWKNVIDVMCLRESAWKLCVWGWVQYTNLQQLLFIPMSRSILSFFCLSTSPASSLSSCCRQYWVRRVRCHKAAKGSSWKGSGLCGLIPQICSVQSLALTLVNPRSHPEELRSGRAWGLWMDGCVPVQDGIRQVCRLLVLSVSIWVILWERFFEGVLIINCPFGNMNISYLPIDLLTNSLIWAFWKLAQPHLLRVKREDLSLLSTQQQKNSHEWQLRGQQQ